MRCADANSIELRGEVIGLPLLDQVSRVRSRAASRISWHLHDGFEILFLMRGRTNYEFEGGRTVELPGGHFLVVPPAVRHRGQQDIRAPGLICGLALRPLEIADSGRTPFAPDDIARLQRAYQRAAGSAHAMDASLEWLVLRLLAQLGEFPSSPDPAAASAALRALICVVLTETSRRVAAPPTVPDPNVGAAMAFLAEHSQEANGTDQLARLLGLGRTRVFEVFRSQTGLTPHDYLQRLRVEHAEDLLRRTGRSVTDIALEAGFGSGAHLANVFRRYVGQTPSAFRRNARSAGAAK